jgi:transposase
MSPYVDQVLVCDPQRNSWIAKDEFNDDTSSAIKLGKLHSGGFLKEIHHPDDEGAQLRGLFLHYFDLNQQLVRFKNKLKAGFRQEAIPVGGKAIYNPDEHAAWLKKLQGQRHLLHASRQRFELVDLLEELKQQTHEHMVRVARKQKAFKLLDGIPGAGPVIVTGYLAIIETPDRFSRKNKLWRYAALGNVRRESDDVVYADRASKSGNRVLKWVVCEHFEHAVKHSKNGNRFKRQYEQLLRQGRSETAARRHVCRALLSTVRAMWRKGEAYHDNPLK